MLDLFILKEEKYAESYHVKNVTKDIGILGELINAYKILVHKPYDDRTRGKTRSR
jgi:hypothetical protein